METSTLALEPVDDAEALPRRATPRPKALETGLREAWPDAYGLALALSGEPGRAADLAQEAMLRIWKARERVDAAAPLRPLVLTVVRRVAAEQARRGGPGFLDLGDGTDDPGIPDRRERDPAAAAAIREEAALVGAAIDRLPPLWRAVIYLRDGLGLSTGETGAVLERTEETVRVTLHRARLRLRAGLRNLIEGDA